MEKSHQKRPTIKDVAIAANLSTATVSHVLNNTRYVSDKSREKVNEAIKALGYYPNQLVGGLRKKRSYTVGLVLPCISNETMGGFAERLQRSLLEYQENLIICNTSYDPELEALEISNLIKKRVDAIVSFPTSDDPASLEDARQQGIPVILVDRKIEKMEADAVLLDNYGATIQAVDYLASLGHREIVFIDRKKSQSHSSDQRQGYCDALARLGAAEARVIIASGYDYAAGYQAASDILRKWPDITACLAYYDVIAQGAIRGFMEAGKNVPGDISVVGYDCMPFVRYASPTITSIEFPIEKVAREVCRIAIQRIRENDIHNTTFSSTETVTIEPILTIGESTKSLYT